MKKLIAIIALFALIVSVNAQEFSVSKYFKYTGVASDTVNGGSDSEYVTWSVGLEKLYFYQIEAEIEELTGSATGYVQLEGSNDNSHWNMIDTLATYSAGTEGLTDDGTVYIADLSTGTGWKFMRAKLWISTDGKWDINYVIVRIIPKYD